MKDDYLWDGSGEPDPEVQKLETALGRYRHNKPAPAFDQVAEIRPVKHRWSFFSLREISARRGMSLVWKARRGLDGILSAKSPDRENCELGKLL